MRKICYLSRTSCAWEKITIVMSMEREEQDPLIIIEDLLSPVTVMHILKPIKNNH